MTKTSLGKICALTFILTIFFQIATRELPLWSENNLELQSAKSKENFGNISVAVATNIGTRYKERSVKKEVETSTVIEWEQVSGNEESMNETLIKANMLAIKEYHNILKTDVAGLLANAQNKKETLDTFLSQIELRYKNGSKNLLTTQNQLKYLQTNMSRLDAEINSVKEKMNADFKNVDVISTMGDKNDYLKLKAEWTESRLYAFYFSKFIAQYEFLNNYNKKLLDTLINNRDVISKDSYVVFPDSGDELLRDLKLVMDEETYKATEKQAEEK